MKVTVLTLAMAARIIRQAKLNFNQVQDPRRPESTRYDLGGILNILVASATAGGRTLREAEEFVQDLPGRIRRYFGLAPQASPSDTMMYNLLKNLGVEGFRATVVKQVKQALKKKEITHDLFRFGVVAFDGKAGLAQPGAAPSKKFLQTTGKEAGDLRELHHYPFPYRVHLVSSSTRVCLDQEYIHQKHGEATTFPRVFKRLLVNFSKSFKVVTADAAMLSYDNCAVVDRGGKYYVFALKKNQVNLYKQAQQSLANQPVVATTEEQYQGFMVRRELRLVSCLCEVILPGATELWSVVRTWFNARGKVAKTEERFFVTSIPGFENLAPQERLLLVRLHWGIENNGNWTMDVIFEEDQHCACSKGNGPFVLGWLRVLAFNLVAILRARLPQEDRRPVPWARVRKLIGRALLIEEGVLAAVS